MVLTCILELGSGLTGIVPSQLTNTPSELDVTHTVKNVQDIK